MTSPSGPFRALRNHNFRLWSGGGLVSNLGAWMQRTAQDWLVLTELTRHDAGALGLLVACQFAPQVLLLPWTGSVADYADRRRLLLVTQGLIGLCALGLAILVIGGWARLWHVYGFALLLGAASAFDAPARQTFVGEMVGEDDLSNAVALNSMSVNVSRLIGPGVAGLLIAAIGSGWMFAINAASTVPVLLSLTCMRTAQLHSGERSERAPGAFVEGLRYVRGRPGLIALLAMLLVFGAFGLNFPIFIATMSASVFHVGSTQFGLITSAMALGSLGGALLAAWRTRPTPALIVVGAMVFGVAYAVAAVMPNWLWFGAAMVIVGAASQTVTTSTTSLVQLSTEPRMRGRVMALLLTVALGGQPVGAPLVGWVANSFGPRWAVAVGAAAGFVTAAIGWAFARRREASKLHEAVQ